MKSLLYIMTSLVVIGLAFWAYHENYRTQEVLGETEKLQAEIAAKHQRLGMLRAEWAYLNRPDRLRELADLNFERLALLPLAPDQFGRVDQVVYPVEKAMDIENSVEVSSDGGRE